jgi:hypothetical protein
MGGNYSINSIDIEEIIEKTGKYYLSNTFYYKKYSKIIKNIV